MLLREFRGPIRDLGFQVFWGLEWGGVWGLSGCGWFSVAGHDLPKREQSESAAPTARPRTVTSLGK